MNEESIYRHFGQKTGPLLEMGITQIFTETILFLIKWIICKQSKHCHLFLRYYTTFKGRKFESTYKITTFLQKTTTCTGLQVT